MTEKQGIRIVIIIYMIITMLQPAAAQPDDRQKQISGIICDSETLAPLPDAVMLHRGTRHPADAAGRTGTVANIGDTLTFRYIGYKDAHIVVSDTLAYQNIFGVFLSKDTVRLSEVVVRARPLRLAEMSAFMPVVVEPHDIIASQNVKRSTYTALTEMPAIAWDAEANQQRVQNRHIYEQEYRHMLAPDQQVGISTAALALIYKLISTIADNGSTPSVRPVSGNEVEMLIEAYGGGKHK